MLDSKKVKSALTFSEEKLREIIDEEVGVVVMRIAESLGFDIKDSLEWAFGYYDEYGSSLPSEVHVKFSIVGDPSVHKVGKSGFWVGKRKYVWGQGEYYLRKLKRKGIFPFDFLHTEFEDTLKDGIALFKEKEAKSLSSKNDLLKTGEKIVKNLSDEEIKGVKMYMKKANMIR